MILVLVLVLVFFVFGMNRTALNAHLQVVSFGRCNGGVGREWLRNRLGTH